MPRSSAVLAHPNSQPYGLGGKMFFTARSTSSATQSSITGFQTPSIMKTSRQQTSHNGKDKLTFSREASLANLSAQQGSDLERTMTATSGLRCYESSGRYSPLSSLVRTLLVSSRWYSPAKRLRWEAQPLSLTRTTTFTKKNSSSSSKQSVQTLSVKDTPSSRLLFRLVPSVRPTNETECGSSQEGMFPHLLIDTLHEGVLRRPCVDESEGKTQRLQERNEVQQPTEPSGLLRHSSHASNTRAEGMRERQTEVPFPRSAPHALSGGDTTQQAHQGTEGEGREDDGQQSQRRATPQRSDGLHQLSRHTADPECSRGNEMGYGIQPQQSDGVRADGDGYQWDVAYTECRRCDDGGSPRQERQNSTDPLRDSAQGNPDNEFQPRSCKDGSTPADTLRPGLQEEGRELQAEGIARDVPQMRLAADPRCERRDACHDDDGQPQGASQEERGAEQLGGADCPQDWWRDFPTVSPICRGNDGLPFDISRLTIPFTRWRQESIKALGNSMVPQVVLELFRAIEQELL